MLLLVISICSGRELSAQILGMGEQSPKKGRTGALAYPATGTDITPPSARLSRAGLAQSFCSSISATTPLVNATRVVSLAWALYTAWLTGSWYTT